jgi:hypothetical protein
MATVVTPSGTGSEVGHNRSRSGTATYATVGGVRMARGARAGTDGAITAILLPQINNTLTGTDIVAVRSGRHRASALGARVPRAVRCGARTRWTPSP